MDETLSSEEAVETLEKVIWSGNQRVAELWSWGYEYGVPEPHRWHAGVLHGYWLALPDEAESMALEFEKLYDAFTALEIVAEVSSVPYEITEDSGLGGPLVGEQWRIRFSRPIVYTHRDSTPDQP